jgi:hypothetical protein
VVRQWSAKPPFPSSNLGGTSKVKTVTDEPDFSFVVPNHSRRNRAAVSGTSKASSERLIVSRRDDTTILRRASDFFMTEDIALAEDLPRRGAALEPRVALFADL